MTFNIVEELRGNPVHLVDLLCMIADVKIDENKRNRLMDIIRQLPEKATLKMLIDSIHEQELEELLEHILSRFF